MGVRHNARMLQHCLSKQTLCQRDCGPLQCQLPTFAVVLAKENFRRKHGRLFCEACDFDFSRKYGNVGDGFIEVHHITPVSELPPGAKTSVEDLVLVCSNCHRILHRRRPWLTIPGLRVLLKQASLRS
jgi:putative restriction endonuclease